MRIKRFYNIATEILAQDELLSEDSDGRLVSVAREPGAAFWASVGAGLLVKSTGTGYVGHTPYTDALAVAAVVANAADGQALKRTGSGVTGFAIPTQYTDSNARSAVDSVGTGYLKANGGSGLSVVSGIDWSDVANKPSTFTPSSHTHAASEITDFNTAWTARLTAFGSGATTGHAPIWNGSVWAAGAYAYGNLSGVPSTFTPSTHNHTASEITDFATEWTTRFLSAVTTSGGVPYRTAVGGIGESKQGTSALGAYAIDWSAAHRFTKTLAGGDSFTHSNTEAKAAIYLVLAVNGQGAPSGIGTQVGGETWSSAWTTAYVWITKDGSGGYEHTLSGA